MLGLLGRQVAVTVEALDALAAWAAGDSAAAQTVRDAEPRGDIAKRKVLDTLREAFVTPLAPEDLFLLSRGIDWVLDFARDLVEESEAMRCPPDERIAEMATLLGEAMRQVGAAIALLESDGDAATAEADAAIKTVRRLEHAYYAGTAELLEIEHTRERISRRELYRRCSRIGETLIDVAERVVYAVVKQS